ncbi:hypothetical protein [Methanoplanus endosymbiosus]|uniref:Uncharacterized protein n=1 Tax=Methanoplanus endosymbiosus TaxID=33865 RepID=A0A9E7PNH2_9EURY|nr:hypothetical protein [Methanoplanus endosymbiosus]UUX93529.1 hypothetical protein L6E24_05280 [Methanoplanus endosymbiosus]
MDSGTKDRKSEFGNIQVSEVIFSRHDVGKLSRNIEFSVKWDDEDGEFILFSEEFNMQVNAPTLKQGMLGINDNFRFLYDNYLSGNGDNLTEDEVLLKDRLAELFNCKSGVKY